MKKNDEDKSSAQTEPTVLPLENEAASTYWPSLGKNPTASQIEEWLSVTLIKLTKIANPIFLIIERLEKKEHPDPHLSFYNMIEKMGGAIEKPLREVSGLIFMVVDESNEDSYAVEAKIPITAGLMLKLTLVKEIWSLISCTYEACGIFVLLSCEAFQSSDKENKYEYVLSKIAVKMKEIIISFNIAYYNATLLEKDYKLTTKDLDIFIQFWQKLGGMKENVEPKKEDGPEQWGPTLKISDITKKMGWPSDRVTTLKIQVLEKRLRVVFKKWGSFFYEKPTLKTLHEYNDHEALKNAEKTLYRDPDRKKKHSEK